MAEIDSISNIIREYYTSWADQNREAVRRLLADDLLFVSPQDTFDSADGFLKECWRFSEGLSGVRFKKELYDERQGFVILDWSMEDGSQFMDAEYVHVDGDRITKIIVVNNSPDFTDMIRMAIRK